MKFSVGWWVTVSAFIALTGFTLAAYHRDQLSKQVIVAVNQHDAPQVDALLQQGADPNSRDWQTYRAESGLPLPSPWYQQLWARFRHQQPQTNYYVGPTVLMIAAAHANAPIVQSLLKHGADTAKVGTSLEFYGNTQNGVSSLWEADIGGNESTKLLIIRYATRSTINRKDQFGLTPLMGAAPSEVVTALIARGADVNAVDDEGDSPILMSARMNDPKIARILLDKGADINTKDRYGQTPLMRATTMPQPQNILNLLLARGADVNTRDKHGRTALINAAEMTNIQTLKLLLSHKANSNAEDNDGETALMWVSYDRSWMTGNQWKIDRRAMQRLLLKYGANPHLKDKDGKTAADYETEDDPDMPAS